MHREYHKWFSPNLDREMELLVFGNAGPRVLVFPTRQGRFYDYENFGLVDALRPLLHGGQLQLFCVDSVDSESLYGAGQPPNARIARHVRFEQYVLDEVLPLTAEKNPDTRVIAHGCSIGAYHAVNIALRHPALFHRVVALSGRYDLTQAVGCFPDLFDGYYDETIYFHTPNHFIPNLCCPQILHAIRRLEITLAIGERDHFYESNRALSHVLWSKDIWHALDVWPGKAHKPRYWREMLERYFQDVSPG